MDRKVIIVGYFIEIVELAQKNNISIVGYFDLNEIQNENNLKYLGNDKTAEELFSSYKKNNIIITPDSPQRKEQIWNYYNEIGYKAINLISNQSIISKSSKIGDGVVIQDFVNVSSQVIIGNFVKLNTACNIMHNSSIGEYTTIAPNAVILGYVNIGNRAYIGANATILPNLKLCDDVIVGAGAVVTKDILEPGVYIGMPAKKM